MSEDQEKQAAEPGAEVKVKVRMGEKARPEDDKP